jgi:hypothetical protein
VPRPAAPNAGAVCRRQHQLITFEAARCPSGHEHRIYRCPMRVGVHQCGDRVAVPPYTPSCRKESTPQ